MDTCNGAYQTFIASGIPSDYTSMRNACNTARSDMTSIQVGFSAIDTSASSPYGTTIASLTATSSALSSLPSNAVSQCFSTIFLCYFFCSRQVAAHKIGAIVGSSSFCNDLQCPRQIPLPSSLQNFLGVDHVMLLPAYLASCSSHCGLDWLFALTDVIFLLCADAASHVDQCQRQRQLSA